MDTKINLMMGKTKDVAVLQGEESPEDRIEISEHLLQNLQLALVLKRNYLSNETEILLTKETATQLSNILERWTKGKI